MRKLLESRGRDAEREDPLRQGQWEQVPPSPGVCTRSERSFLKPFFRLYRKNQKMIKKSKRFPSFYPHWLVSINESESSSFGPDFSFSQFISPISLTNLSCVSLDGLDLLTEF